LARLKALLKKCSKTFYRHFLKKCSKTTLFGKVQQNHSAAKLIIFYHYKIMAKSKKRTAKKWTIKYKKSIDCRHPKGFSQKQYCKYGRKRTFRKTHF
jgi:hypothetical protein